MVVQNRSYVVDVLSQGGSVVQVSFHTEENPQDDKKSALEKAESFMKEYADEGYTLVVMCFVDGDVFYLDSEGNEDTEPIDWFNPEFIR